MIKKSFILFAICLIAFSSSAQRKLKQIDEEEAQKQQEMEKKYGKAGSAGTDNKWVFGGNLSGSFGNNFSFFLAQPMAGYAVKPQTIVGGGATYIFSSLRVANVKFNNHIYGPIAFIRQNLGESIFLQADYQPLNYLHYHDITNTFSRQWQQVLYVGAGYGALRGAFIGVFYNVLYKPTDQIYASPYDIRIGFLF